MKINKIFIGVLLVTIASLGCYIYFTTSKPANSAVPFSKKTEVVTEAKLLARKVDKKGLKHIIVEETNNVLPANLIDQGYSNEFVDSLLSETDIQKKEIIALTRLNQSFEADNLKAVKVISTLREKVWEYKDTNLSMSFKTDSIDNGEFGYSFNQDLDIREYSKRKWFLGKEHQMMDISSTSKFSTINKVNKLTIEKKQDPFDVTASGKALYIPKSGRYGLGSQLRIRYKDLTLTSSNLYFPNNNKWINVYGAEYRILKF